MASLVGIAIALDSIQALGMVGAFWAGTISIANSLPEGETWSSLSDLLRETTGANYMFGSIIFFYFIMSMLSSLFFSPIGRIICCISCCTRCGCGCCQFPCCKRRLNVRDKNDAETAEKYVPLTWWQIFWACSTMAFTVAILFVDDLQEPTHLIIACGIGVSFIAFHLTYIRRRYNRINDAGGFDKFWNCLHVSRATCNQCAKCDVDALVVFANAVHLDPSTYDDEHKTVSTSSSSTTTKAELLAFLFLVYVLLLVLVVVFAALFIFNAFGCQLQDTCKWFELVAISLGLSTFQFRCLEFIALPPRKQHETQHTYTPLSTQYQYQYHSSDDDEEEEISY